MEQMYKINLDGRLDEAAWESAKTFTDFRKTKKTGGELEKAQTICKVLADKDRVYFGFKCFEPEMELVEREDPERSIWGSNHIALFVSPSGGTYDFYQFITFFSTRAPRAVYYAESGNIRPDPYAPDWKSAVYKGEDFWSVEMEIPMTAFYMTGNDSLSNTWLINPSRCRTDPRGSHGYFISSPCKLERGLYELDKFLVVDGFPKRPAEDDLRIVFAETTIESANNAGYDGTMLVNVLCPMEETFRFASDYGQAKTVTLREGKNEFTVPCHFDKLGRYEVSLELTRARDGKVFKRWYPITVSYDPIVLQFTAPEYRCNFYPGQDYSKIAGKVIANKPVTLKLEGPGIETTVISPEADGSFCFETPNFEIGEAWLTATIEGEEKKQKIRRLAPTGKMMTWISKGNLVVNGKPVLSRAMFSYPYRGSKVACELYEADNFHETREITKQKGFATPDPVLARILKMSKAELYEDRMPSQELLDYYDKLIEEHKDKDFAFYYLADEPECRGVSPIYLKNLYEYIAERDPYHVVNIASRSCKTYLDCADWFETHPYIVPNNLEDGRRVHSRPLPSLGSYVDQIAELNRPDKSIGVVPLVWSAEGGSRYADYPNFHEILCGTWAPLIHGGKSVRPYAFGDMYDRPGSKEGCRYLFSSLEALEQNLLHGKRTTLLRTSEAEAVLYDSGDEKMFVAVNFKQQPQTITLDGISGTWHYFRHGSTLTGNTFTLQPLEVMIGTSQVKDADLPTYEETVALVEKLEAQRVAGCSKLVPLRHDIAGTKMGVGMFAKHKLFDGVRNNLGMRVDKQGERFCELDFTKVKVEFSKVVISGWNMKANVALKIKNGEEWTSPAFTEIKATETDITYILKDTICPDAVRMEFYGDESMDISEFEVF
ncbi:MAG: hypothetical protein IJA47_02705 [Oscillospiraceae bacterium]|nr:hypothetical protein [Oscillospiraceae bacterium]